MSPPHYNFSNQITHDKLNNPSAHYRRYRNYDFKLSDSDQEKINALLVQIDELRNSHNTGQDVEDEVALLQKQIEGIFTEYRFQEKRLRDEKEAERMKSYFKTGE